MTEIAPVPVRLPQAPPSKSVSTNACKLCTPLGACLAFRGVEGAVPILHGSQGCATYIRRYIISHFREPFDVASSSFGEMAAIHGGAANLSAAIQNVVRQYQPELIGIATTCLAETIGDDLGIILSQLRAGWQGAPLPALVPVSTPSYTGTHAEGFRDTLRALVETLAEPGPRGTHVNLVSAMLSPEDIRHLRSLFVDFGLQDVCLPDYSDTLDGGSWDSYHRIPEGGTSIRDIRRMGSARATVELAELTSRATTAGGWLKERCGVPLHRVAIPIGIAATDALFAALSDVSGRPTPAAHERERARLVDSYVDGHKYVFGKRVVIYGEADFAAALAGFAAEIGLVPVLVASGGAGLVERVRAVAPDAKHVSEDADFEDISRAAKGLMPDLILGNGKGMQLARSLQIPLVRVGFPIHDRFGAARVLHVGYRGTQTLFDRVVNALLEYKQSTGPIAYSYL